jgi:hypothetical protein
MNELLWQNQNANLGSLDNKPISKSSEAGSIEYREIEELQAEIQSLQEKLYLSTGVSKAQSIDILSTPGSRMVKVRCFRCGCIARITREWLDEIGAPSCGCGWGRMEEDE